MKKIALSKETIRRLDDLMLDNVIGGGTTTLKCPIENKTSLIMYETSVGCCKKTKLPFTV